MFYAQRVLCSAQNDYTLHLRRISKDELTRIKHVRLVASQYQRRSASPPHGALISIYTMHSMAQEFLREKAMCAISVLAPMLLQCGGS